MEKNYYKILQIDRNASPEIIEKAYKTLAKKYHPDLQSENNKEKYGEIFKVINEAYQTLSDPYLKASYDKSLSDNEISRDKYDMLYRQNQELKSELNDLHSQRNYFNNHQQNIQNTNIPQDYTNNIKYEQEIQQAKQKAYHDAYIQDLKSRGYKIRERRTFSDYLKNILSFLIVLLILSIFFQLPFMKKYMNDLYNDNPIIRLIANIFINLFNIKING